MTFLDRLRKARGLAAELYNELAELEETEAPHGDNESVFAVGVELAASDASDVANVLHAMVVTLESFDELAATLVPSAPLPDGEPPPSGVYRLSDRRAKGKGPCAS